MLLLFDYKQGRIIKLNIVPIQTKLPKIHLSMSFIHEKAKIHTLNKSTEIFDPVKSKRRYKFIILII